MTIQLIGNNTNAKLIHDILQANNLTISDDGDVLVFCLSTTKEVIDYITNNDVTNKIILNYSPSTIEKVLELDTLTKQKNDEYIQGAIICQNDRLASDDSYVCYSGKKESYEKISDIVKALKGEHYEGEEIIKASLMEFNAIGIHYTGIMAIYTGVAMCKKYGFDFGTYLYHTLLSMPSLSEAAYRSVWDDFAAESDFSDVDDVIHATEMLCCYLKKTGGKELLFENKELQKRIENILHEHWDSLMNRYESLASNKEDK